MRPAAALALLGLLAGCTLIDQRTFNPDADRAPTRPSPPAPPAPPPIGPPPLLTIAPDTPAEQYSAALLQAVAAARARKADVVFDVVELQRPETPPDTPLGAGAATVARLIVAQGIPATRVRLVARPDALAPPREIRVYVR